MNKFFVTTAIDYTNDVIHIGHAYQKILADALARYHRLLGENTHFLTGTDEHGQKVEKSARTKNIDPQKYVDEIATEDKKQWDALNISYDRFIRTTDEDHIKFSQDFYLKSKANGDIYKGKYEGLYCEGCEACYEASDLVDGKCLFHPNREILHLTEENYFFKLSKYQDFLLDHIEKHPEFIWPEKHRKEIVSFIKSGLRDFSVSRPKEKVSFGIPVPDDDSQTIYVWFDALINYLTYGDEEKCWPADVHVLGKDNQRFHAIYWPAMLKSAGYELPKTILVHEFISLNGQKISKSLGNVILPTELTKKYGVDGVRYFFLRYGPLTGDIDITLDKITEVYNADLANGLGNLVARVVGMIDKYLDGKIPEIKQKADSHPLRVDESIHNWKKSWKDVDKFTTEFRVDLALDSIWKFIAEADKYIDAQKPWELAKNNPEELKWVLYGLADALHQVAWQIRPFLPATAEKVATALGQGYDFIKNPDYKASWVNVKPGTKALLSALPFPRI